MFSFFMNVHALDYTNEETGYKVLIEDDADLLTNEEEQKLLDEMTSLTQFGNIAFHSISTNYTSAQNYAKEYYHKNFSTSSGTLFLIDMDNRKIYIFSDGANYKTITNSKADIITDNIYKYATKEQYYECTSEAIAQINTLLNNGKIAEPMKYLSNGVLALSLAFLINFIFVYFYSKLKTASVDEIIANSNAKLTVENVTATKTGVDRVYSPVEHSSGGGSSGGGGGGGGSSGGGGGHSF